MISNSSNSVIRAPRWMVDEPKFSCMKVDLTEQGDTAMVTLMAMTYMGPTAYSLQMQAAHGSRTLDYVTSVMLLNTDGSTPDCSVCLERIVQGHSFCNVIVPQFVAQMHKHGMLSKA